MNILFLDIDGVLCAFRSHLGHFKYGGLMEDFDPMSCNMINMLCYKFNFKIVISSTWRYCEKEKLFTKLKKT